MGRRIRLKVINLAVQKLRLMQVWPAGVIDNARSHLVWRGKLRPTPFSPIYSVQMNYSLETSPQIYVLRPLLTRNGQGRLPHVYSTDDQQLCLHYPPERKWRANKLLADTIVPWIGEWLYFYEIWVATGIWKGGGTHREDQEYNDMHIIE